MPKTRIGTKAALRVGSSSSDDAPTADLESEDGYDGSLPKIDYHGRESSFFRRIWNQAAYVAA